MSNVDHVIELLPAYAIGAIDKDEVAEVDEHLAVCATCRAELAAYRAVVGQLALATPDVAPPAGLKKRLMAQVQPPRPAVHARSRSQLPQWPSLSSWIRQAAPAWGWVSLILIVALGVSNVLSWQRANQPSVIPQPDTTMRTVTLVGTDAAPDALGTVILSLDGDHGALVVDGLASLDTQHQYQVWLIQDGQRTSGGVFSVDENGYGVLWLSAPRSLSDYDAFGVTIEPAGGSPGPTGTKVLGGNL